MEIFLLACIVLLLTVLVIVLIQLARVVINLKNLEQQALISANQEISKITQIALPEHIRTDFSVIIQKHEDYLDELLKSTISSADKKLHLELEASIHKKLKLLEDTIEQEQSNLIKKIDNSFRQSLGQIGDLQKHWQMIAKKISNHYEKQLIENYNQIAWQYISEALSSSVDLHSQKDAIFKSLESQQANIKKDFSDVD